jgi:hypothetical protein
MSRLVTKERRKDNTCLDEIHTESKFEIRDDDTDE